MPKKLIQYFKQNQLAFWIALIYVSLGGAAAYTLYPSDPFSGNWGIFILFFTFPVNIFSTTYRFTAEEKSAVVVIILQAITFIYAFIAIATIISKVKKKENKNS